MLEFGVVSVTGCRLVRCDDVSTFGFGVLRGAGAGGGLAGPCSEIGDMASEAASSMVVLVKVLVGCDLLDGGGGGAFAESFGTGGVMPDVSDCIDVLLSTELLRALLWLPDCGCRRDVGGGGGAGEALVIVLVSISEF